MNDDQLILNEFKEAIQKYSGEDVVRLDSKFKIKFEYSFQRFEEVLPEIGFQIPPNKWSYYRISLMTNGSANFICGIYKFKAQKNTLILTPANVINTSTNYTNDTEGPIIVFNLDFFLQNHFPHKYIETKKILQPSAQPYIRLTKSQADEVEAIFKVIQREQQSDDSHKNELITLKVIELLILADRFYVEEHDSDLNQTNLEIVKKFSNLIESNFDKYRSVAFYATQLHVHPNYLNSLVKAQTGATAKESILSRLILEAKYLLQTTSLSIKEIAAKLGFDDPNYFTSFFKRCEKVTPAAYRASYLKI